VQDLLVHRRIEIGGVHLFVLAGADGKVAHGASRALLAAAAITL
jgi:hypothetical protein